MVMASPSRVLPIWVSLLIASFGGIAVGAVLNVFEIAGIPGASDFGNYFGLWIMLVTLIAAWSGSWWRAVLHAVFFLLTMIAAYYVVTLLLLGYFLSHLLRAWMAVALVFAPPFAALVWYGRKIGWTAAVATALPVSLLLYEAYRLRLQLQLYSVQFVFDILAAVLLLFILPAHPVQRFRVVMSTPPIFLSIMVINEYVLPQIVGFSVL